MSAPAAALQIPTAAVFRPLLEPSRYKGAFGGRGSGKSHFFAELLVEACLREPGTRAVCIREFQRTLAQSSKQVIEAKVQSLGLGAQFESTWDDTRTPGGGVILYQGMQNHTAETIKSLEGCKYAWVDEAQSLSARSLALLRPTIRVASSELWFSWNPRRKNDAIDEFLRIERPVNARVVQANWRDNPWWNEVLEQERLLDLQRYPERYDHIWEGEYAKAFEGAYFARQMMEAKAAGRIGAVVADPLLPLRAFWDLGGAGASADAMAIWITQWVGQQIFVLDYLEGQGQVVAYYVNMIKERGYGKAINYLPHDGLKANDQTGQRYVDHLRDAGLECEEPMPNQGRGAAAQRIEAVRRIFARCWFNEHTTEAGRDALGYYHERKDTERNVGLGPEHDWCLAAGTQVLTPDGWRNVQDIAVHNEVLTPTGTRPIVRSGIVRMTSKWATVNGIRCTPEHRFFTSRGLVEAGSLSLREKFWTRGALGLNILAFLSVIFRSGFTAAITLATPKEKNEVSAAQCSFIAWFMRLCMVKCRLDMKSIISMITRSITTRTIFTHFPASFIAASTNHSLDMSAFVEFAGKNSVAITPSVQGAVQSANELITPEPNESAEPAYNLTVAIDECYFVRGDDGLAYLVSNSSHAADAFGLLALKYEQPRVAIHLTPRQMGRYIA